jgi:nitrogen fixation/metabolism regulation signal transduction histidine kinase
MSYIILIFLVLAASLFVPLMMEMERAGEVPENAFRAANLILFIHDHFWLPGLLCLLAVGIHSVRTSHRIAGPIYRLKNVIGSVKQGILPPPLRSLRKGDYLVAEFELINQMVENLRLNIEEIQEAHSEVDRAVSLYRNLSNEALRDESLEKFNEIARYNTILGEKIGHFKIQS